MKEKVAILFDVQNLYHASKNYGGSKVSYKDLLKKIGENREVVFANAYSAHKSDKNVGNFYKALEACNISVISKPIFVKRDTKKDTSKLIPVHFDVEITTDALMAKDEYEDVTTIALCTGNGNFSYLVEALKQKGLKVEIWSFKESTSKDLLEKGQFIQIPKEALLANAPREEELEETQTNAQ